MIVDMRAIFAACFSEERGMLMLRLIRVDFFSPYATPYLRFFMQVDAIILIFSYALFD